MKYVLTVAANILSLTILAPVTQVATSSVVEAKVRMYDHPNYGYCPGTLRPVENLETAVGRIRMKARSTSLPS
jgi:hypothetical protein